MTVAELIAELRKIPFPETKQFRVYDAREGCYLDVQGLEEEPRWLTLDVE